MGDNNINPNTDPSTGEKTFTQEDVNRIVGDRLAKEKAKNNSEADFAKREQELARREIRMTAKELLSEKGLPVQLFDALNCTDEEATIKSIETIEKIFNEYKANLPKPVFKGFQPGASIGIPTASATEDIELRKAMGLRT